MIAQVHAGPKTQTHRSRAFPIAVFDMDRILFVGNENAFFDYAAPEIVAPDGQSTVETEFDWHDRRVRGCTGKVGRACEENALAGHAKAFGKTVKHHEAPERIGQRRNQESVIAACYRTEHRSRGIPAKPVRDQPLLSKMGVYRAIAADGS